MLADANAIVKRLRSAETLGLHLGDQLRQDRHADAEPDDRRRDGHPGPPLHRSPAAATRTEGIVKHVVGQPDIPLEPFLLPMVLASDADGPDGEMVGDPTEGALVVLAEKGGLDTEDTRQRYPRVAELPFDAAYKLMATFHRMTDEPAATSSAASSRARPDQLLARAA